jgi:hypothetical protein
MIVVHSEHARGKENRTERQVENNVNLTREKKGYMSNKTKSKVKGYIDTMLLLSQVREAEKLELNERLGYKQRVRPTLATLTLPSMQAHDDKFIRRYLLNPFVKLLKEKYGVRLYLWVAEAQSNGNVHFHILLDRYIENVTQPKHARIALELTKDWNRLLALYGYIEPYRVKMQAIHQNGFWFNEDYKREVFTKVGGKYEVVQEPVSYEQQYAAYLGGLQTGWQQPNTVDIHALKERDNIKAYICKYLTKVDSEDTGRRKIEGRLWGCSDQLRAIATYEQPFDDDLQNTILDMRAENEESVNIILVTDSGNVDYKTFEDSEMQGRVKVFAEIYSYSQMAFWRHAPKGFKQRFEAYYRAAFYEVYRSATVPEWVT